MSNGMKVYVFNAREGITRKFNSTSEAERFYNIHGVYRACKLQRPLYMQYFVLEHKPSFKEELEFYKAYCKENIDENLEFWRETEYKNIKVSNLGRVKRNDKLVVPRLNKKDGGLYTYLINGYKKKVAILVAEAFILNRKMTKDECAFLKGSKLDVRAEMIFVKSRSLINEEVEKTSRYVEVALLENGEVKEIYNSIREAARKNFVDFSGLSRALRNNRSVLGMVFKRLEEVEGW